MMGSEEIANGEDMEPDVLAGEVGDLNSVEHCYRGPPILVGVVREGEEYDFCMCNPPFFESIEEAGLNPKTSCGGTHQEMVCPGGERAFISRIIEDSLVLKYCFRWFTSMIGRKTNLKFLVSKLREVGVSIVKTTEFVQGQTARWGLGWSFMPPNRKPITMHASEKSSHSFMLEGLERQRRAIEILKFVESLFLSCGASCRSDFSTFSVDVTLSNEQIVALVNEKPCDSNLTSSASSSIRCPLNELCFSISIFEQIPGTLLVKGSLLHKESPFSGTFSLIFQHLEGALRNEFIVKLHGTHDK
uniref:Methyltransferase-like protein 16 n=2 Tax=Anthurium amnicola TaxID=1678845 RepID=A0A1D1ZJ42_9ARAE